MAKLSYTLHIRGVIKRCRLFWLTNRALVFEPKFGEEEGGVAACGDSAKEYSCTHGAQINFGDVTTYLTYAAYKQFNSRD
jgi:hypothetical protein